MSLFKGIGNTKPMGGRRDPQAKPGRYLIRVDSIRQQKSAKPPFKDFISAEGTVVKVLDDNQGLSHQVGHEFVELMLNYGPGEAVFLSKVAGVLQGILNQAPDDDDAESAVSADQPLKGLVVEMSAIARPYSDKRTKETKIAVNRNWHRSLSKSEVEQELDPALLKRFFPNGVLSNPFAPDEQEANATA